MTSREEASTLRRFFQYVEDGCLGAYDQLVIQNASDISRESDRLRKDAERTYLRQKKRQGEAIKRIEDEASGAGEAAHRGKHLRMGCAAAAGRALGVRSQSLDSVGAEDDERRRPPPKPKRDPGTKLSSSSEALHAHREASQVHACGEDCKKTPPPKPRRDPNTQLSSSFDDGERGRETASRPGGADDPEPVYIEMAGTGGDESVYEEMKWRDSRRSVPQPFPNLLTQRPPLLVLPPSPPRRSPNSDESPLTPVDPAQLSMPGNRAGPARRSASSEEEWPSAPAVTPSGRSSAPPLSAGRRASSGPARDGRPRSQSACPSPVSAARSRTPACPEGPPPYRSAPPARRGASPDDEEPERLRQPARSWPSAPGRERPAPGQTPWLRGDATVMETMEKKRVLCGEIKSRRRADDDLGKGGGPPERGRKRPPPYWAPPAASWDTAI